MHRNVGADSRFAPAAPCPRHDRRFRAGVELLHSRCYSNNPGENMPLSLSCVNDARVRGITPTVKPQFQRSSPYLGHKCSGTIASRLCICPHRPDYSDLLPIGEWSSWPSSLLAFCGRELNSLHPRLVGGHIDSCLRNLGVVGVGTDVVNHAGPDTGLLGLRVLRQPTRGAGVKIVERRSIPHL